jgi:hypothetical protein
VIGTPRALIGIQGVAKDTVAGKEVQAHIYEWVRLLDQADPRYTSQVVVSDSGEVGFGSVPVQIVFCLKEQASVYESAQTCHASVPPAELA